MFRHLDHRATGRFLTRLGHSLRALLLLCTLAAVAAVIIWTTAPHLIHEMDRKLVSGYIEPYENRMNLARAALARGEAEEGRALVLDLLQDLESTAKGDRLTDVKVRAFDTLAREYARTNEHQARIDVFDRWIAFDDRDLRPQIRRAVVMRNLPERRAEGDTEMYRLSKMAPSSAVVIEAMTRMRLASGGIDEAFQAFREQLPSFREQAATLNWSLFWDTGSSFNGKQRKEVKAVPGNALSVKATHLLPAGTYKGLRIDMPPAMEMQLYNARFTIGTPDGPVELPLARFKLGLHHVTQSNGALLAKGTNPFIELRLKDAFSLPGEFPVTFTADIVPYNFTLLRDKLMEKEIREGLTAGLRQKRDTEGEHLLQVLLGLIREGGRS
ncbi:MAG: hypothetical protein QNK37_07655 [Acidobacteriota bacterium]|nr:hypothetical protein [Acidobacteriota bacterium]